MANDAIYGLSERDLNTIFSILKKYGEVTTVYIFGSRAKGNYKAGSDIDLAIMNAPVADKTLLQIKNDFEESSLPYHVDLVYFKAITHPELIAHIERVGKVFYESAHS
jgi:predicted nucleotidyltransferase